MHIDHLPDPPHTPVPTPEQTVIAQLTATLREADVEALCEAHAAGSTAPLDNLLHGFVMGLQTLSDTIAHSYFSHAGPQVS